MNGYDDLLPSEINDDNSDKIKNYDNDSFTNRFDEVDTEENANSIFEQYFPRLSTTRVNINNSDILTNIFEQEETYSMNNRIYFLQKIQNTIKDKELRTYIIDLSQKTNNQKKIVETHKKKINLSINKENNIQKSKKEEDKLLNRKKQQIQKEINILPTNSEKDKKFIEIMENEGHKENNNTNTTYNCKNIIKILQKNSYPNTTIKKIKEDAITQKDKESISIYLFEIKNKKRKRKNKNKQNVIEDKDKTKKGRKTLEDNMKGNHKKDSPDNIIKKIKALFFTSVIKYIEMFLDKYKKNYEGKIKLLTLDYAQYVNRLKKEVDLELLDKPLKDIASLDTSKRYHRINDTYWNKKIIEKIIEKEKDNKEINDLLNMSFNDWIDIFTYKKDWEYNIEYNKLRTFIEELSKDDDEEYFTKFMLYLYNYKRWFTKKAGRNRDNLNNNQGMLESKGLLFRIKTTK